MSGGSSSDTNDTIRVWDCPATFSVPNSLAADERAAGSGGADGSQAAGLVSSVGVGMPGMGTDGGGGGADGSGGGSASCIGIDGAATRVGGTIATTPLPPDGDGGGGDWSYEKSVEAGNGQAVATIVSYGYVLLLLFFFVSKRRELKMRERAIMHIPPYPPLPPR